MAEFKIAKSITDKIEGGYANNPDDTGGETYAGISRNNWPDWEGWMIIDQIKKTYGTNPLIIDRQARLNPALLGLISEVYKQNFWDVNKLDQVNDQQLADSVYDFGVNSGIERAAKYLQESVNLISGLNLVIDGIIGQKTISGVNLCPPAKLYLAFNKKREAYYRSIATGSQAQFLASWLSRIKPYKS